jgi:alcohol dehydrogenase class IV
MEFSTPACMNKLARLAAVIGADVHGLSTRQAADLVVRAVVNLLKDVELPISLKEWGVQESDMQQFADYIYKERQHMYLLPKFNARKLTSKNTQMLMDSMYRGEIEQT